MSLVGISLLRDMVGNWFLHEQVPPDGQALLQAHVLLGDVPDCVGGCNFDQAMYGYSLLASSSLSAAAGAGTIDEGLTLAWTTLLAVYSSLAVLREVLIHCNFSLT